MARIKLSPPWDIYYKELKCLFCRDKEVFIIYDEDVPEVKIFVENDSKAYALSQILPTVKDFGTVSMKITIIPANDYSYSEIYNKAIEENPYETAFKDNPVVKFVKQLNTVVTGTITYVVFVNEVVQYFNDNIYDFNGICSTLYQEIAKNIFKEDNSVHFCTDMFDLESIYETEITSLNW